MVTDGVLCPDGCWIFVSRIDQKAETNARILAQKKLNAGEETVTAGESPADEFKISDDLLAKHLGGRAMDIGLAHPPLRIDH